MPKFCPFWDVVGPKSQIL